MYHGGKYDLRFGSAKSLQLADEFIQMIRAFKNCLDQNGIFTGYMACFDHVGAIREKGIKLRFSIGGYLQIDKGAYGMPQNSGIADGRAVSENDSCFFHGGNPCRDGGGGCKDLLCDGLDGRTGVVLQDIQNGNIDLIKMVFHENLTDVFMKNRLYDKRIIESFLFFVCLSISLHFFIKKSIHKFYFIKKIWENIYLIRICEKDIYKKRISFYYVQW